MCLKCNGINLNFIEKIFRKNKILQIVLLFVVSLAKYGNIIANGVFYWWVLMERYFKTI